VGRPKGSKNKKGKSKHDPVKLAAILGISVEEAAAKIEATATPEKIQHEAEATLAYAYNRGHWYNKECKSCGKKFASDYQYVAYCSMPCRKQAMNAIGLGWNPSRTEDQRWEALGVTTPGIVPPAAIEALRNLARKFAAASFDDEISQPDNPHRTIPVPETPVDKPPVSSEEEKTVVFR
jgi:hypothetical protein